MTLPPVAPDLPEGLPDRLQMYVREWMHDPCFDLLPLPRYPEDASGYRESDCTTWEPRLQEWLKLWQTYCLSFAEWHDQLHYTPESWHELDLSTINQLIRKGYRFKHLASVKPYGAFSTSMHTVTVTATPAMTAQRKEVVSKFAARFGINLESADAQSEFERLLREGKKPKPE